MQTMSALLRVSGSREMTVQVKGVTPGEAWLLMHIHDPATKDAFEDASLGEDVQRTKVEERARLIDRYPQQRELIDHLFPGRTAADVPTKFGDLEGTPLEVAAKAQQEAQHVEAKRQVEDVHDDADAKFVGGPAPAPEPLDEDAVREQVGASKRKK